MRINTAAMKLERHCGHGKPSTKERLHRVALKQQEQQLEIEQHSVSRSPMHTREAFTQKATKQTRIKVRLSTGKPAFSSIRKGTQQRWRYTFRHILSQEQPDCTLNEMQILCKTDQEA